MANAPIQLKKVTPGDVAAVPTGYVGFVAGSDGKFYAKDGSSAAVEIATSADLTDFQTSAEVQTALLSEPSLSVRVDPLESGKKYVDDQRRVRVSDGRSILDLKPALLYDASVGLFSDAGTTPALSGGSIYRIADQSGNSRYAEQTSSGKRPTLQTVDGRRVWRTDGTDDVIRSVSFKLPQPCTVYAVFQQAGTNAGRLFDANTVNGAILNVPTELQKGLFALSANVPAGICSSVADVYACVFNGSSSILENGLRSAYTGNPGSVGWGDGVCIGGAGNEAGGFFTAADWYYLIAFPKAHTLTERNLVRSWIYNEFNGDAFVHCVGDSLTAGTGASAGQDYPTQMTALLDETCDISNTGVGGITAATIAGDTLRNISQYTSALRRNIICVWAGTNDLIASASAADTYNHLKTLWLAARTAGHRVVAATVIARGNFSAGQETARVALNALIKSDPSLYDALADVAYLPQFDEQSDCSNTTYYNADTVHLNGTGYGLIAAEFAHEVNYLLTLPPKWQS